MPSEAASCLARSRIELGNGVVLGDRSEQLSCFRPLALFDQRKRGHLAGAAEPWLARFSQRLEPRDHLLRLDLVEFERGLADECRIAIRLRQSVVRRERLVGRDRSLQIALLNGQCSARNSADARTALLPLSDSWSSCLLRLRGLSSADVGVDAGEPLDLAFRFPTWCWCHQIRPPLAARNRTTPAISQLP